MSKDRTHCRNGHDRSIEGTFPRPGGMKGCVACRRLGRLRILKSARAKPTPITELVNNWGRKSPRVR